MRSAYFLCYPSAHHQAPKCLKQQEQLADEYLHKLQQVIVQPHLWPGRGEF